MNSAIARTLRNVAWLCLLAAFAGGCDGMSRTMNVTVRSENDSSGHDRIVEVLDRTCVERGFQREDLDRVPITKSTIAAWGLGGQGYQRTGWIRISLLRAPGSQYEVVQTTFPAFDYTAAREVRAELKRRATQLVGATNVRGF